MQTTRTNLFPQKGHGIESNKACPAFNIKQINLNKFEQYFGIGKVQIYLVFTKSRPYVANTSMGMHRSQQRRIAWARDQRNIRTWINLDKVFRIGFMITDVINKPQIFT